MDEKLLENRIEPTNDVMMDNPVSEIAREYLALDGLVHDESDGLPYAVGSVLHFLVESEKARLIVELERESVDRTTLVPSALIIGFKKF